MDLPVSCLSDFFIQRGQILHSDIFASIDHGKFFVVMGVSEDEIVGFFYINSDINRFINTKEEQLQMQILIKKDDYSFLSQDSFICATNIVRFPKSQMIESDTGDECDPLRMEEWLQEAGVPRIQLYLSKNGPSAYDRELPAHL